MLMAKTPISSVQVLLLQGHILILISVHTCKIAQQSVFFASDSALITAYMGLASGGNTTGSFDFELFHETGLFLFFF